MCSVLFRNSGFESLLFLLWIGFSLFVEAGVGFVVGFEAEVEVEVQILEVEAEELEGEAEVEGKNMTWSRFPPLNIPARAISPSILPTKLPNKEIQESAYEELQEIEVRLKEGR
jgi:hypothetical protein